MIENLMLPPQVAVDYDGGSCALDVQIAAGETDGTIDLLLVKRGYPTSEGGWIERSLPAEQSAVDASLERLAQKAIEDLSGAARRRRMLRGF